MNFVLQNMLLVTVRGELKKNNSLFLLIAYFGFCNYLLSLQLWDGNLGDFTVRIWTTRKAQGCTLVLNTQLSSAVWNEDLQPVQWSSLVRAP